MTHGSSPNSPATLGIGYRQCCRFNRGKHSSSNGDCFSFDVHSSHPKFQAA
ncbi:hypothetical protein HanPI659440_Chr15g0594761 [Helianthus annuus]|uniref:Uncharacterized protein n=1 Tax=Helianthus annuus TaxID=4232 RepID=A0A251UB89_HELAN|nr:hypothetical protein HanXRQr2_Chr17g0795661 [Helianthus annuus]KAJ0693222.1 hypothetical protein HanPI659440_Chr15g0594761 [Helianthus annuus]